MIFRPYEYQRTAMQWIIDKPRCGLFLDMGLGKTVSTLTALQWLIDDCEISRTLVVAPKKVAETTWSTEAEKWEHLHDLRVVKVIGTEKQRCMALGVAFLAPLYPKAPALLQLMTFPCSSLMLTIVLLNEEWMCATPRVKFRLIFFFLTADFFAVFFLVSAMILTSRISL